MAPALDAAGRRVDAWFAALLAEGEVATRGARWADFAGRPGLLAAWVGETHADLAAFFSYARVNGPHLAWRDAYARKAGVWPALRAAVLARRAGENDDALARLDTTDLGADAAAGPSAATLRADILVQRGQPDAALRTLTDEVVPAASRLGDAHLLLVCLGRVADGHMARGRLDEALRILREELLPTLDRLVCRTNIAMTLARRAHPEDLPQIRTLLAQALHAAHEMHLPEAAAIETLQKQLGLPVGEALPD